MNPNYNVLLPVPAQWQVFPHWNIIFAVKGAFTGLLLSGIFTICSAELLGNNFPKFLSFLLDLSEEVPIFEGFEGMEEIFFGRAWEKESVNARFWIEVIDGYEAIVVVYDA